MAMRSAQRTAFQTTTKLLCALGVFSSSTSALRELPALSSAPRGSNSWYNFFGASNETETLATARYQAQFLLPFGYDTVTIDEGWSDDGEGGCLVDAHGRLTWSTSAYPHGLPWLASQLHGMGLKLGLWIVRGVPRKAALERLPVWGTNFTADEAVRLDRNCSWSGLTFGGQGPAAVAYYGSLAAQMASWGVDFVKIDCMWPNKYEGTPQVYFNEDVEMETAAFTALGNISVSLSPGISVSPMNGSWVAHSRAATIYRIAEDVLDVYDCAPDGSFPQCVHQKFAKAVEFEGLLGLNGTWPDFDMLQVGATIHSYGSSALPPSETRLTRDEQVTSMTLWCATGTPLIIGGRLPLGDDANGTWTLSLLTNAELLAVHNGSAARFSFLPVEAPGVELYGWAAVPAHVSNPEALRYVTLYNAEASPQAVSVTFAALGLPAGTSSVCLRDLWAHAWVEPAGGVVGAGGGLGFSAGVAAHGARAFLVAPLGSPACYNGLA